MKKYLLLLLLTLLLSLPTTANIGEPKGFLGKAFTSTVALYGTYKGKSHYDCTATVYEKISGGYHLITAGHCIQDIPAEVTFSISDQIDGPLVPVKVLKVREEGSVDFAQLELITNKIYPVMELGDENTLNVGDEIINPNFADGLGKQLSIGRISSQALSPTRDCPLECKGGFLIQEYGAAGSSGSAVISKKTHKIVGIVVWGFDDANVGMGAIPISIFRTFLQGPTQAHPAPPTIDDDLKNIIIEIIGGK